MCSRRDPLIANLNRNTATVIIMRKVPAPLDTPLCHSRQSSSSPWPVSLPPCNSKTLPPAAVSL